MTFRTLRLAVLASLASATTSARAQQALQLTNTSTSTYAYARIPNSAAFSLQQFTVELWFRPDGPGYGQTGDSSGATLIGKPREGWTGTNLSSWNVGWVPTTSKLFVLVTHVIGTGQGSAFFSNATIPIGTSAHIALSFDGTTIRLFVNGQLDNSQAFGYSGVDYGNDDVLIGATNFGAGYYRWFTGVIDDVRIWDHVRDGCAIEMLRNCRLSGTESGLIAYYTFNGSSVADDSGQGHGGTIVGPSSAYVAEPVTLGLCGSPSQSYCTAGTSTNGCTATLAASGTASVSASSGFVLTTNNVEGQKSGLLFYGISGPVASPWMGGNSVLCVKSPVQRTTVGSSGGTAGSCNGSLSLDFLAYVAANPGALGAPFGAGELVRAQTWYRDPPSPGTTNLSDAICFATAP